MGILSSLIITLIAAITMFKMMIGTYDDADPTLLIGFIKGIVYFGIGIWYSLTTGEDKETRSLCCKIRNLCCNMKSMLTEYRPTGIYYGIFTVLPLYIFVSEMYFTPICIFGIHEFFYRKWINGAAYLFAGNLILALRQYLPFGRGLILIYCLVASIDILRYYLKKKR